VATVPNGTATAKRNLIIDNPPSAAFAGRGWRRCVACVSIQRWATTPDPIGGGPYIDLFSNGEFTKIRGRPSFTTIFLTPDVLLLMNRRSPRVITTWSSTRRQAAP
jgi:hypothetical protein